MCGVEILCLVMSDDTFTAFVFQVTIPPVLMSLLFRPWPNSDAILAKEISSALILTIVVSTSAVQVILLGTLFAQLA